MTLAFDVETELSEDYRGYRFKRDDSAVQLAVTALGIARRFGDAEIDATLERLDDLLATLNK